MQQQLSSYCSWFLGGFEGEVTEKEDFEKEIELGLHKFYGMSLSTRRDCTGEDASLESFIVVDKMGTDCDELFSLLFSWTVFINICNRTE